MPGKLRDKAMTPQERYDALRAKQAQDKKLTPQERYKARRGKKVQDTDNLGPKEQTLLIRQDVKRGGIEGATVGKSKLKQLAKKRRITPTGK